jgi:hypothetical protein
MSPVSPVGLTAGDAIAQPMSSPMIGMRVLPMAIASFHPPPSLPVAASRDGNLFTDRFDSNLHWYLPEFALVADVDPGFAFAVRETGQQANGQPFLVARLSLRLGKRQPVQVTHFAQANPHAALREIPLENLVAVLSSAYMDENGNPQQHSFRSSSVQDQGDGTYLVVFDGTILGASVLAVYQDLRAQGKADRSEWEFSVVVRIAAAAGFSRPCDDGACRAACFFGAARSPAGHIGSRPTPGPRARAWGSSVRPSGSDARPCRSDAAAAAHLGRIEPALQRNSAGGPEIQR